MEIWDNSEAMYEMDTLMQAAANQEWLATDNSNRILKKLKRTLKPKIWQAIEWDLRSHMCLALGIVSVNEVAGTKRTGHDYFGESTAVRHVYDETSNCSYSDTYGGNVYLYLGGERYLKMHISG